MERLMVKRAAVLGAGVMGAQIAAHLANANIPVYLFDLPAPEGEPNAVVHRALAALKKAEPAPFADKSRWSLIEAAHYGGDLAKLQACDLVIEAIAEKIEWKHQLYAQIAPHLGPQTLLVSNTSGLSVQTLAQGLPANLRSRFCGMHFFNPPRYMPLVELIPTPETAPEVMDALETWLTSRLGKGVIRAFDTPNFVANRVGVFSMLAVMHHTQAFGLGFDEVDALTGPKIGRPKSATYRTADVVGLDTLAHVIGTMQRTLGDDPWHPHFQVPLWLQALLQQGALGQKTRGGIFRKQGKQITVLDLASAAHRPVGLGAAPEVEALLNIGHPGEKLAALRASSHPQARFLWAVFRDVFHYVAVQLEHMADNARDVDLAMRWGFGWAQGPFETWQAAGWQAVAQAIEADRVAGLTMAQVPLPAWVHEPQRRGVHSPQGSYSARLQDTVPRSVLPVYWRQCFLEGLYGEALPEPETEGETLYENAGVRLWCLPEHDQGIGILSIRSKMHTIGEEVLDGLIEAVHWAEQHLEGLVLWQQPPFAVGANLKQVMEAIDAGAFERLEATVAKFQQASQTLKLAQIPVVAAVQGLALGGGCEFVMHAHHRVLALESYIGLVEAGVGLIPAGGGCKEFALQAADWAGASATPGEVFGFLQPVFQSIAMAKVGKSAHEAVQLGFARATDTVLFQAQEVLWVALRQARARADTGHVPAVARQGVVVAGKNGIATFEMMLTNLQQGGMISAHDYRVAKAAATALCGGEVETGMAVDEEWLLTVERRLFVELLRHPLTQARIRHMLDTGKPLRN